MVTSLLRDKPRDPVPYIYTYLLELSNKVKDPKPLSDNEVNDMRNLRKKADYIREKLNQDDPASDDEDSPQSDEEQDIVKPESRL